jgi:hypothetical protein
MMSVTNNPLKNIFNKYISFCRIPKLVRPMTVDYWAEVSWGKRQTKKLLSESMTE